MKIYKILVPAVALMALTSCFSTVTSSSSSSIQKTIPSSSSVETADALNFIADKQFYLDLNIANPIEGFYVKVNDNDVSSTPKQAIALPDGYKISFGGNNTGKLYIYYATKKGTESNFYVNSGIRAGTLERFGNVSSFATYLQDQDRVYLCISDTEKGWDHSLSEQLNNNFEFRL